MALTTKVLLNKVRKRKDGTYPLVIRVTFNRKVIYIPLGYTLYEKDFDPKNQKVKNSAKFTDNITRLNNIINAKTKRIYDVITELEDEGIVNRLPVKEIKNRILGKQHRANITVPEFIDELINDLRNSKKFGNATVYKTLKNKLVSFTKHESFTFEDIDYRYLMKLEASHFAGIGDVGGLSVYMRTLRAAYNKAIKAGITSRDNYPFDDYKIRNSKPVRKALSVNDFDTFKSYKPEKSSPDYIAKQMFMASFYLRGMNWMDMAYLKISDVEGEFERISYVRKKTGEPFNIKIVPKLKDIMLDFLEPNYDKDDYIFPILRISRSTNEALIIRNKRQRLNKKLKKIAKGLGMNEFTIYAARHTYATMGKRKGVPTAVIQESLGHKTESMTQTYLDSFDNKIVDDYDALIMED